MNNDIQFGAPGSSTSANAVLDGLVASARLASTAVESLRLDAYNAFERRLIAMNSRRHNISRLPLDGIAYVFSVEDFLDTNQSQTSCTVRADVGEVTLREHTRVTDSHVSSIKFGSSAGYFEFFDPVYRVVSPDAVPSGIFDIQLDSAAVVSLVVFDYVMSPSRPSITVEVSETGATYNPVTRVSQAGYRCIARMTPQSVKFIRVTFVPVQPDVIGAPAYSFGITDLHVLSNDYSLSSGWTSKPVTLYPRTPTWQLQPSDTGSGIQYSISLDGGNFLPVAAAGSIDLSAYVTRVSDSATLLANVGTFNYTVPADVVIPSLQVSYAGSQMRLARGLSGTPARQLINWTGTSLVLAPYVQANDSGKTFTVSYLRAPAPVTVILRATFSSSDRSQTPAFNGAKLVEL